MKATCKKNKIISHVSSQTNITKFKGKYAVLAIPDSLAFKKNITVTTQLSIFEIKKFVHMEVRKYFSDSVMVDFCLTNAMPESNTVGVQINVLRSNHVLERIKLLRILGLHTKIVEVESFAIERTARTLFSYAENEIFAILDLNPAHQRFFVFTQNRLIFMHEDLVGQTDKTASKYCLLVQIKKRLHHFSMSYPHYVIQKIWLMGYLSFADEAFYKLQYELNINIQYLDVLHHSEQNMLQADVSCWITAYGLALRGSGYE